MLLILSILFSGCDFLDSEEIKLKKISSQTQKDLAVLESQKEIATIQKEQELERIRLQTKMQESNIVLGQEKEIALFEQNFKIKEQMNDMQIKRYILFIITLLLIIISFFIFYYFKKKREDKLIAYNDNLKKYFHQKENETRAQIAQKLLDTIAAGNLSIQQENQLISALHTQIHEESQVELPRKILINQEVQKV